MAFWRKKLKYKDDLDRAYHAYFLLKEKKIEEAMALCSKDDIHSSYVLALALEKQGKKEEALELFLRIVEKEPFYLGIRERIVELAEELGMDDVVSEHAAFLACVLPELEEAEEEVVELVEESVEPESVEEDELLVLDELDEEEFVTVDMVYSYMHQFMFEEAYQQLLKLLERDPDNEELQELKSKLEKYLEFLEPEEPIK
ncbi:hypothetical protein TST_0146 [Thermosulfidibacter takaii ABI70S6]|uniref:Tetratricopeptide repeat protein n=1 Tax=Thermosulfidibacter takaii (strain DSM 17441 / JCM 13301 / NBRC 103674 / ABI70S6) TaxID=1298851 RepID=A0A0S3QRJ7_THET7|nr:hypothetical protein [Thermosulfidibacter takaii]BAT70956.1 hypothetical protein TST_0146 [Thermosulfidibacter takaii ABI70S6]